jgi:hypothetical protein
MKDEENEKKCVACRLSESSQVPENERTSAVNVLQLRRCF